MKYPNISICGCVCICIGGNYKQARTQIEKQLTGKVYSMMMATMIKASHIKLYSLTYNDTLSPNIMTVIYITS